MKDILKIIEGTEESSVLWHFDRYIKYQSRWNALFIVPFKHMWE